MRKGNQIYLLAYLPAYLPIYLLTYLLAYIFTYIMGDDSSKHLLERAKLVSGQFCHQAAVVDDEFECLRGGNGLRVVSLHKTIS